MAKRKAAVVVLTLGLGLQSVAAVDACGGRTTDQGTPRPDAGVIPGVGAAETGTTDTAVEIGAADGPAGGPTAYGPLEGGTEAGDVSLAAAPTFSPPEGTYHDPQSVSIVTATPYATIYFTTDGTTPNQTSLTVNGPLFVARSTVLQAYAAAVGYRDSDIVTAVFDLAEEPPIPPALSPRGSTQNNDFVVTMTTADPSVTICYTLDGSEPYERSCVCQPPSQTYDPATGIVIDGSVTNPDTGQVTVNALSCGLTGDGSASPVAYTLQVGTPTVSPPSGPLTVGTTVTWTSATTAGVTFHFTSDGTLATCDSPKIGAGFVTTGVEASVSVVGCKSGYAGSDPGSAAYTY